MGYNSKYKSSEIEEILDSVEGKQDKLISGTNIKTINGESILGTGDITIKERELEKYATDKSWSIVASNLLELSEKHGNAPDGTKAIVVAEANSLYGVNLFDSLMGTVDGVADVFANLYAYTLEISAIDTSVELPVSTTSDVRVEVPFNQRIYIDMGADMASIYHISVKAGFTESVWGDGYWNGTSYMIGNKMPLSKFDNLDDNAVAGLMAIAPALIVDFVGTKTITEYVKNGDNWEVWSEGESVLSTKLNAFLGQIAQLLPTKTSQLENDSNFVSSDNLRTINGESILGSGDITIESGAKIYEWFYDGDSESVTLSQEEYDNIVEADIVVVSLGGIFSFTVSKTSKEVSEALGHYALIGQFESESEGIKLHININIEISTKVATITTREQEILTKTSQLENDSNFITSEDVASVALSGSYNDLQDTPTIPSAVTESTVSGWGFTKNTGTYSKPSGGIPKSDLDSATQQVLTTAFGDHQIIEDMSIDISDLKDEMSNTVVTQQYGEDKVAKDIDGFITRRQTVYALPDAAGGAEDDVIATVNTLKTINGQSILGSGDIDIRGSSLTESDIAAMGFTKNTGTYSKPSSGIPKTDLASAVQTSLGKADTAVQPAAISDFVTIDDLAAVATSGSYNDLTDQPDFIKGVAINGTVIADTSGTVYIPNASTGGYGVTKLNSSINSTSTSLAATPSAVKAAYDLANSKQDTLISGTNIKTINGQSIVGSGNLIIEGGSGGGEDIRYFTDFTVEDFIEGVEGYSIIREDTTALLDAVRNNKVICVPFRGWDKGYKIAYYKLYDESGEGEIQIYIELDGVKYEAFSVGGEFLEASGLVAYASKYVFEQYNDAEVYLEVQGNTIYDFSHSLNYLCCIVGTNLNIPSTIRFYASEDFTLEASNAYWANGVIPQFEGGVLYELSLSDGLHGIAAVLTPFKAVE